jgi:hypothetical protein
VEKIIYAGGVSSQSKIIKCSNNEKLENLEALPKKTSMVK